MSFIYALAFMATLVCAAPDYGKVSEQGVVVNLINREFISHPATFNEKQKVEALSIADTIKQLVDELLKNIPDPVKIADQNLHISLGDDTSIAASSHGVRISGQSSLYTETLRVNLLIPIRPRITYEFVLPELKIDIDSAYIKIDFKGITFNCHLRGQVSIVNSNVQGTATINVVSQTLTELTTRLHVGTIQSSLVGSINGINITNLINTIVTDIVPQILSINANAINEFIAKIIMGIF